MYANFLTLNTKKIGNKDMDYNMFKHNYMNIYHERYESKYYKNDDQLYSDANKYLKTLPNNNSTAALHDKYAKEFIQKAGSPEFVNYFNKNRNKLETRMKSPRNQAIDNSTDLESDFQKEYERLLKTFDKAWNKTM